VKSRRYQLRKEAVGAAMHHPWIFRGHMSSAAAALRDGELLRLVDGANRVIGYGLYEATGAIAIRILRRGPVPPDAAWLRDRIAAAVARRAKLAPRSDAIRLIHGESDGIPAVVVDRFGDTLVVSSYAAGADALARYAARVLARGSESPIIGPARHVLLRPARLRHAAIEPDAGSIDARPPHDEDLEPSIANAPLVEPQVGSLDTSALPGADQEQASSTPLVKPRAGSLDASPPHDDREQASSTPLVESHAGSLDADPPHDDDREPGSSAPAVEPRSGSAAPARVLRGSPPAIAHITEDGLGFAIDLAAGQKTGAYLDLRGLRREVAAAPLAGARVLNLFAYSGMLGRAAERAGAAAIVQVDASERALAFAAAHHVDDPARHALIAADVFAWLPAFSGEPFDLVIVDPPAMTSKAAQIPSVLAGYRKLYRAAARHVRPGGALIAACCTSRIERAVFQQTVRDALGPQFTFDHEIPPEADHPVGFTQADYLKIGWWRRAA
jgi:23S rRNA G2069 N7-methylase RlmK/C1962 C5-methylase RlmI